MNTLKIILKSVVSPLGVISLYDPKEIAPASFTVVALTSVFGSVIAPAAYYLYYRNRYQITLGIGSMITMLCISLISWLAACALFWTISRLFKKGVSFRSIISSWGFSYIPNLFCIIAYGIVQLQFNSFIGNSLFAVLINTFFIMLLVWKAIYYFLEVKYVMKLGAVELLITTIISGIAFMFLMGVGFAAGIQIPML